MLGGRRQDLKAVFDSLPIGSLWNVVHIEPLQGPLMMLLELQDPLLMLPSDLKQFNKQSEEDWVRLEQYMDTEESKPRSMRNMLLAMLVYLGLLLNLVECLRCEISKTLL